MTTPTHVLAMEKVVRDRIDDEVKKLIAAQIHEELAKKVFDITITSETKYTKDYGKYVFPPVTNGDAAAHCIAQQKVLLETYKFPSDNIYVIHTCVKYTYGNGSPAWEMQFIDNYGMLHYCYNTANPSKPQGLEYYKYPLSNKCIDMIQKLPKSVSSASNSSYSTNSSGGNIAEALAPVQFIKSLGADIFERDVLIETIVAEKKAAEELLTNANAELATLKDEIVGLREKAAVHEILCIENARMSEEIKVMKLGLDVTLFSTNTAKQ